MDTYTHSQALTIGAREICRIEGHRLAMPFYDGNLRGGVQGENAACDEITCKRCDVKFTATYPPLATPAQVQP